MREILWLIPLFPLLAFVVNGLLGPKFLKKATGPIASAAILGSFAASVALWIAGVQAGAEDVILFRWVASGAFKLDVGFTLDPLTVLMLLVVTGVSFVIHVYSIGYMARDPSFARFFTWLPLFVFSMVMLVMANNFLSLYVFWEMVGVCSYLLIGFWHERPSASAAAVKAFLVNRVGDFGFAFGVLLIFWYFGSLNYKDVFPRVNEISGGVTLAIALLLFLGAMGKSAQFPLHVWLPDALEGPTPVSALIHAATMVAAGAFLVARTFPLFEHSDQALTTVAVIGGFTALFAATMGLVMNDIKRVIAYSTISQLGYMMLGLGTGGVAIGIIHLFNHAFFKALLFLGAGSVNHATGTFDMREMGGMRKYMPWTATLFFIAALSLAGIWPLAGFWSKDEVLAG